MDQNGAGNQKYEALDLCVNVNNHQDRIRLAIRKLESRNREQGRSIRYRNLLLDVLPKLLKMRQKLVTLTNLPDENNNTEPNGSAGANAEAGPALVDKN